MDALVLCFLLQRCDVLAQDDASRHHLLRFEERVQLSRSSQVVEMAPIQAPEPFDECLVSWNVDAPEGAGFQVELRVGRGAELSPWLFVGEWGRVATPPARTTAFELGEIDVDVFRGQELFERAQLRVQSFAGGDAPHDVVLRRIVVCFTRTGAPGSSGTGSARAPSSPRLLAVAARSAMHEERALGKALASPACLSMVLAYRGVDVSTAEVAARAYDSLHGSYGTGSRAIQAAYSFGVPGYLARYANWSQVQKNLLQDVPLIASIASEQGELRGAPRESAEEHWVVIVGLDLKEVHVLDPAASAPEEVARAYDLDEFARAWFGNGGVAYVLLQP